MVLLWVLFWGACGEELERLGSNATKRLRATMRDMKVDVLGVRVRVGCTAHVRSGNATIRVKCGGEDFGSSFDLRMATPTDLERCSEEACGNGLWRLRSQQQHQQPQSWSSDLALLTSVSDLSYLWKYWRWILNKLCVANTMKVNYYLWVGAPVRGGRREGYSKCPAAVEEPLAHTTKALSLYLTLSLAKRVIFLDADAWFYSIERASSALERWISAAEEKDLALPAPCYKQFFGAAVVMVSRSDWIFGFLHKWYDLRCGPKDQPSLWSLVLDDAGLRAQSRRVLELYQDPRCLDDKGELTKNQCSCEDCGYYAAWTYSNTVFREKAWPSTRVGESGGLYEIPRTLFLPHVAYLPNVGPLSLLCGTDAVVGHVKFLRKKHRELPQFCGQPPRDALFKGPRDDVF